MSPCAQNVSSWLGARIPLSGPSKLHQSGWITKFGLLWPTSDIILWLLHIKCIHRNGMNPLFYGKSLVGHKRLFRFLPWNAPQNYNVTLKLYYMRLQADAIIYYRLVAHNVCNGYCGAFKVLCLLCSWHCLSCSRCQVQLFWLYGIIPVLWF